jgi:cyclomaltodextrinase
MQRRQTSVSVAWAEQALFYHIYPLGALGAPRHPQGLRMQPRLNELHSWLPHLQWLGVTALYIGPLFESSSHGYDTRDYYHVDRRLGDDATLRALVDACHALGIRVVLDGVFNHVGRDFWAFRDLRQNLRRSPYTSWFHRLRFDQRGRAGDPFSYEGWKGHYDLVKLSLRNRDVRAHLFGAVRHWIERYDIDGLRLDAADCMDLTFLKALGRHTRSLKHDFWLMGEVVHGDYRRWTGRGQLDAITNYELYDALHRSHNARDYHLLTHALDRQFGPHGVYRDIRLFSFVDNHDVTRIASLLKDSALLYPLHLALFLLPGIPSLYYGSEWGQLGKKGKWSDAELRPALHPSQGRQAPQRDLMQTIRRGAALRREHPALLSGGYRTLFVNKQVLAFERRSAHESLIGVLHLGAETRSVTLPLIGRYRDLLEPGAMFESTAHGLTLPLYPTWGRLLQAV